MTDDLGGKRDAREPESGVPPDWIDLRGSDGERYALRYSDLRSVGMPSLQSIVLEFLGHRVVVRGRNLASLYDDLIAQRLNHLEEDFVDWAPESDTAIESIQIEPIRKWDSTV